VPRGETHGHARITESIVRHIRHTYELGGTSMLKLARSLGIPKRTVFDVIHRRSWAHVA
jgi:hypothetical protein